MSHVNYEETQRFSQLRWLWIISFIIVLTPFILFTLSDTTEDRDLLLILITTVAVSLPVGIILFIGKFELKVNESGLTYRFLPSISKWKLIDKSRIKSIEIREKSGLYEQLACGYRRHIFRKTIFMNITGNKFVIVKLTDGKTLKIGSQNAETLGSALNKSHKHSFNEM